MSACKPILSARAVCAARIWGEQCSLPCHTAHLLPATSSRSTPHPAPCHPRAPPPGRVEMRDESRLLFVDEFSLSFHIHFYRLLKWLIAAPFAMAAAALLAYTRDMGEALPA